MKFSLLRKKRIENRNKEKTIDEVETKSKRDIFFGDTANFGHRELFGQLVACCKFVGENT